jgi:hypothetical protein
MYKHMNFNTNNHKYVGVAFVDVDLELEEGEDFDNFDPFISKNVLKNQNEKNEIFEKNENFENNEKINTDSVSNRLIDNDDINDINKSFDNVDEQKQNKDDIKMKIKIK